MKYTLVRVADELRDQRHLLLELPPELVAEFESPSASSEPVLVFRGSLADHAVACTSKTTYSLRASLTSNALMAFTAKGVDAKNQQQQQLSHLDTLGAVLELNRCAARLHSLAAQLGGGGGAAVYNGPEQDHPAAPDTQALLTLDGVRLAVQASDAELNDALALLPAFVHTDGKLRIISREYLKYAAGTILSTCVTESVPLDCVPFSAMFAAVNDGRADMSDEHCVFPARPLYAALLYLSTHADTFEQPPFRQIPGQQLDWPQHPLRFDESRTFTLSGRRIIRFYAGEILRESQPASTSPPAVFQAASRAPSLAQQQGLLLHQFMELLEKIVPDEFHHLLDEYADPKETRLRSRTHMLHRDVPLVLHGECTAVSDAANYTESVYWIPMAMLSADPAVRVVELMSVKPEWKRAELVTYIEPLCVADKDVDAIVHKHTVTRTNELDEDVLAAASS